MLTFDIDVDFLFGRVIFGPWIMRADRVRADVLPDVETLRGWHRH